MVQGVSGGDDYMTTYTGLSSEACVQACRHEEDCVAVSYMASEDTSTCLLYAEETFVETQDSTVTSVFLQCPESECILVDSFRQLD